MTRPVLVHPKLSAVSIISKTNDTIWLMFCMRSSVDDKSNSCCWHSGWKLVFHLQFRWFFGADLDIFFGEFSSYARRSLELNASCWLTKIAAYNIHFVALSVPRNRWRHFFLQKIIIGFFPKFKLQKFLQKVHRSWIISWFVRPKTTSALIRETHRVCGCFLWEIFPAYLFQWEVWSLLPKPWGK